MMADKGRNTAGPEIDECRRFKMNDGRWRDGGRECEERKMGMMDGRDRSTPVGR